MVLMSIIVCLRYDQKNVRYVTIYVQVYLLIIHEYYLYAITFRINQGT